MILETIIKPFGLRPFNLTSLAKKFLITQSQNNAAEKVRQLRIKNQQLTRQNQRLILANHKLQSNFLHGLKTPITLLRQQLDIIPYTTSERESTSLIDNTLNQLTDYIDQLARLISLETKPLSKKQTSDLVILLRQFRECLTPMLTEKKLQIESIFPNQAWALIIPTELEECLTWLFAKIINLSPENSQLVWEIKKSWRYRRIKITFPFPHAWPQDVSWLISQKLLKRMKGKIGLTREGEMSTLNLYLKKAVE
ncbi:MAG TPA: hypothetical protein VJB37_01655 [Patescibacteria group bacterium]|nr:hypothetical protein [Patescibacteria group bacterium]